eukprot:NODE_1228_length_945_cov_108.202934_g1182_i0.p1 GENE.NODE_1228_length_945_cov_108.202934_g1182_i0~~NODE_1228_length_945_cov_108.202934_g1182_i0.p1  ORF type:complete len:248 (-),score=17.19 NODE_1228_length_945_cov_108.202934_g1182_i0:201-884(-)
MDNFPREAMLQLLLRLHGGSDPNSDEGNHEPPKKRPRVEDPPNPGLQLEHLSLTEISTLQRQIQQRFQQLAAQQSQQRPEPEYTSDSSSSSSSASESSGPKVSARVQLVGPLMIFYKDACPVNICHASSSLLLSVPGLGPETKNAIERWRPTLVPLSVGTGPQVLSISLSVWSRILPYITWEGDSRGLLSRSQTDVTADQYATIPALHQAIANNMLSEREFETYVAA